MNTCKDCVYNTITTNGQKELQHQCTRLPPVMHLIPTQNGVIGQVLYPTIADSFTACGEHWDGSEEEEELPGSATITRIVPGH